MISVIIPVFNGEKTVERSVGSVLASCGGIELEALLIDDGSTDATAAICDRLAEDPRIRVFHTAHGGASAARNVGLKNACGAYIGFADSDDWVEPDLYQKLLNALEEYDADLAACAVIHETEYGTFREKSNGSVALFEGQAVYREILRPDSLRGYLWNKLYRRSVIDSVLDETVMQCEDLLFNVACCGRIRRAVYLNEPLYHYVRKGDNDDYSFSKRALSLMDACEKLFALYTAKTPQFAHVPEQNALKTYLHFRARTKMVREKDSALSARIAQGIHTHFGSVLRNRRVSLLTKGNMILTFLFPRTMLCMKRKILKQRHRKGIWES